VSQHARPVSVISSQAPLPEILAALGDALDSTGPTITVCSPSLPPPELSAPPQIALVVATSGSTGDPKYVALTGAALLASARATHQSLGATKGQRWMLRLPVTHIAGAMVLVRSLELETVPTRDGIGVAPDFEAIVPTQLHRAIASDRELLRILQSARAVLVGGANLSDDLLARARALGINVITTYGMSETAGGCVYNGTPLPGVQIRTDDESRIEIAGPMLASGYLSCDGTFEKSAAFHDGWFTTSDLGELTSDNRLRVLGRSDEVVITGGMKVSLTEVERIIRTYPGISDALCAVTPDDEWGERILVGIVADLPITLAGIRDYVGARIGRFAAPRAIVRLHEIPLRGIGKPDRAALSKMQSDEEM